MTPAEARALTEGMLRAAWGAVAIVKRIYGEADRGVSYKVGDDPVTRADHEANAFLLDALARLLPGVVLVAEESEPATYAGYTQAEAAFFIDPLDGTREFVARNGEFCVMVGLAEAGRARLGVVACPCSPLGGVEEAFVGEAPSREGLGGFAERVRPGGERQAIRVSSTDSLAAARVLISRSHKGPATDAVLARLGARELCPYGSAGLKAIQVAAGSHDVYTHPGPSGMLWDSCAPEAIVRGAGGRFTDARGHDMDYRRATLENLDGVLTANPTLHALALRAFARPATPADLA